MDFGDGLVMSCSNNHSNNHTTYSDPDYAKPKWYGSVDGGLVFKQEIRSSSAAAAEVDYWRDLKMAKTSADDDDHLSLSSSSKPAAFLFNNHSTSTSTNPSLLLRSDDTSDAHHMLSFSSPNHSQTHFPHHPSTPANARNSGYGLNAVNMHAMKGPFTQSQWVELEHQTLIYKYLTANAPIPSHLLPIRKSLGTAAYAAGTHLRHNPYGWGAFQLGFSGSSDPEPGRCRRTDGKKWRCSRDAVVDQKYCERHMNRGRHRSRKPVEGQTGHTTTPAKLMPMSSPVPASVGGTGGASNSLSHLHHRQQLNGLQSGAPNLPVSSQLDRGFLNKENPSDNKIHHNQYSLLKHHNPTKEPTRSEFGLVCSDSLLNPLQKCTSISHSRNYASAKHPNDREAKSQNSLRQFMDNWPHSDPTQLSISIPLAASSPTNDKLALSPLRLSRELDPSAARMGLGTQTAGAILNEGNLQQQQRQENWWETFMGGPLGEVLHISNNSSGGESMSTSPLNLMTESWDSCPRTRMALSPTGVLQKTAFGSLSNSSAGSSPTPRTENNLLGSSLVNSSLPAM